jgi:hypothetical protein
MLLAIFSAAFAVTPAQATTYLLTFGGPSTSGSADLTTSGPISDFGTVTGITGNVTLTGDVSTITGLVDYGGADQLIGANGFTPVDMSGLAFSTSSNGLIDLYFDRFNTGTYRAYSSLDSPFGSTNGLVLSNITVSLVPTGVPEPALWALVLAGFGGLGAVLRARRRISYPI